MVAVPQAGTFAHVSALEPHGEEAARKLTDLHGELLRLGAPGDAERVKAADTAAERRDFPSLERFVATGIPLDELSENRHARIRRVVGLRNAAALLPLMLTWFILGVASWGYYAEVRNRPNLVTQPFLVLWQHRFGGKPLPTFAETALLSFVLLLAVLLLTVRAHRMESAANRELAAVRALAEDALSVLALAVETSVVRPPDDAKEWAEAAQRVLTETQTMIKAAVGDTTRLAEKNNEISRTASEQLTELQLRAEELLKGVGQETREVMVTLQRQGEQTTTRVGEEATRVLRQAGDANRQLVEQQMTPLFLGFRESLAEYRKDQEAYGQSAGALAGGVTDLTGAASGLAANVGAYTEIIRSIDEKLKLIGSSQSDFVAQVGAHSTGITTATTELRGVAELLGGSMKSDIESLAKNVVEAGSSLATIEASLAETGRALAATTRAMATTAGELTGAAESVVRAATAVGAAVAGAAAMTPHRRPGFLRRLFGRA